MTWKCVILPGIRSPVHGIDFSQMSPQCSSCTHLDSPHGVNISCDLENVKESIKMAFFSQLYKTSSCVLLPVIAWHLHMLSVHPGNEKCNFTDLELFAAWFELLFCIHRFFYTHSDLVFELFSLLT